MTRPVNAKDPLLNALVIQINGLVEREVRRRAGEPAARSRRPAPPDIDRKIMVACQKLADAVDQHDQAKFAGFREVAARRAVERAAQSVAVLMKQRQKPVLRDSAGLLPDVGDDA